MPHPSPCLSTVHVALPGSPGPRDCLLRVHAVRMAVGSHYIRILEVAPHCSADGPCPLLPTVSLPSIAEKNPFLRLLCPLLFPYFLSFHIHYPSSHREHAEAFSPLFTAMPWPVLQASLCCDAVPTVLSLSNSCSLFTTHLRCHPLGRAYPHSTSPLSISVWGPPCVLQYSVDMSS